VNGSEAIRLKSHDDNMVNMVISYCFRFRKISRQCIQNDHTQKSVISDVAHVSLTVFISLK